MKKYVPVIIPTLNRYEHLYRCIESLRRSPVAEFTELYIGFDYPPSEAYVKGHDKIKKYLDAGIEGFYRVNVYERKENFGTKRNIGDLRAKAFRDYEAIIYTEDDNVFAPAFLEYMNEAAEKYKNSEHVLAICGYSYPVSWEKDGCNVVASDTFFSAWGWAAWRDKYYLLEKEINIDTFIMSLGNTGMVNKLRNKSIKDFCYFISSILSGTVSITDISISVYMALFDKVVILPKISLVRNEGWDGTGLHCDDYKNDIYTGQMIDESLYAGIKDKDLYESLPKNRNILNGLFQPDLSWKIRSVLIYNIIKIISPKRFFALYNKFDLKTRYKKLKNSKHNT